MPLVAIRCECGVIPLDKVMDVCTCKPKPYLWSIITNLEERGSGISASGIVGCPAKTFLQAKEDYIQDLDDLHWSSFRGSLVHGSMEKYKFHKNAAHSIIEERFTGEVPAEDGTAIPFSGKLDYYDSETMTVHDWKTTAYISKDHQPLESHILQLYIYAYLLRQQGHTVNSGKLFYIDARRTKPSSVSIPSDSEILSYITPRIRVIDEGFKKGECPPPEPSTLCDGTAKGGKIYCTVKQFCPFFNPELRGKKYETTVQAE